MSEQRTTEPSSPERRLPEGHDDRTDWERVRSLSDDEVSSRAAQDPDAPPTDEAFWNDARLVLPPGKTKISMYVDNDVLAWFKKEGRGYQTRLNAVLRAYMSARKSAKLHG